MDVFSDEDLARLKEEVEIEGPTCVSRKRMDALLARLEAAEALIEKALSNHQYDLGWKTFWDGEVKAWRKASGKGGE